MPISNNKFTSGQSLKAPPLGQETAVQGKGTGVGGSGWNGVLTSSTQAPGFAPPRPGTIDLLTEISRNPTVSLVESIVTSPIRANEYVWEKGKNGTKERVDTVKELLEPIRRDHTRKCLQMLRYGYTPMEPVYGKEGSFTNIVEFRQLRRQITEALIDDAGHVVGFENKAQGKDPVKLYGAKAFWITSNELDGDPYGCGRNEVIRKKYDEAVQIAERLAQYLIKVAGTTIQLHYPEGQSKDAAGALRPNFWLAQSVMDAVAARKCVMFPNLYAEVADMEDPHAREVAAALAGKSQWVLSALDTGPGDHTAGMLAALKAYDEYFFFGWLRSPRTGLESTHGSRADATEHTDTGTIECELIDRDICCGTGPNPFGVPNSFQSLVDIVCILNWGEGAKGSVKVTPQPLTDNSVAGIVDMLKTGMGNPQAATGILQKMDVDAMLARADIPVDDTQKGPLVIQPLPQKTPPSPNEPDAAVNGTPPANEKQKDAV